MSSPAHDWYFAEWLAALNLEQARVVDLTDWSKSKVSKLYNGKMPYTRDIVNEVAFALNILPYELLMHPEEANSLRRLRDSALSIAADNALSYGREQEADGTNG